VLTGVRIRDAAQSLAGRWYFGQARQAEMGGRFPLPARHVGVPLAIEQRLPIQHQRAADLHHHFVPFGGVFARRPEFIGDACAADHGDILVDKQQLAVVAVQVAHPTAPAEAIVETQHHTGIGQTLTQSQSERETAVVIEQATHQHATFGGEHQSLHQRFGARARLHQVQLKIHMALSAGNAHEHLWKEIRSVDQQLETVGAAPREHRAAHVSAP